MSQCNYKIAVIIVFFGEWPKWIQHFLHTCNLRTELRFIVFSDNKLPVELNNITRYEFTISKLANLASEKLGFRVSFEKAYKLCEFKPLYGKILEDYLAEYDFWAYSDIDLFYGDFKANGLYELLDEADVLSFYEGFVSGPFCIYRNTEVVNNLYKQVKNYKAVLNTVDYVGLDEHVVKSENRGFGLYKVLLFIRFVFRFIYKTPSARLTIAQLKYEFQWYVKRKTINVPVDITEVVMKNHANGTINANFKNLILNDSDYIRNNIRNWRVLFKGNKLLNDNKCSPVIFHMFESKHNKGFAVERMSDNMDFKIEADGIKGI